MSELDQRQFTDPVPGPQRLGCGDEYHCRTRTADRPGGRCRARRREDTCLTHTESYLTPRDSVTGRPLTIAQRFGPDRVELLREPVMIHCTCTLDRSEWHPTLRDPDRKSTRLNSSHVAISY